MTNTATNRAILGGKLRLPPFTEYNLHQAHLLPGATSVCIDH
jgi:hypothetical protein